MIQPAAQPAASSSLLTLGVLPAGTEESAGTADFAAFLAASQPASGDPASAKGAPGDPDVLTAALQAIGKVAGKMLPVDLPEGDAVEETAPKTAATGEEETTEGDSANEATATAALALLAALLPVQPAPSPEATQTAAARSAVSTTVPMKSVEAQSTPLTSEEAAIVSAKIAALPSPRATDGKGDLVIASEPAQPQASVEQVQAAKLAANAPIVLKSVELPSVAPAIARRAPASAKTISASTPLPVDTNAVLAEQASAPAPVVTASPATAAAQSARTEAAEKAPTRERSQPIVTDVAAKADIATLTAAELQPVIAFRDAQPSVQTNAILTTAAPNAGPAAHDFAKLVDRLVEAREAATPGIVQTAVSHAEFGRIALRFEQNDTGLTVAMNSADPDFARAVQTAQPVAQAQSSAETRQDAPRQDSQQQSGQTASGSAQQQNTQAQAQTGARNNQNGQGGGQSGESRTGAERNRQEGNEDDGTQSRAGIYA